MKIIKWIGHPVVVICAYLLFITEGQSFGGFYMLYLLLALPHGAPYAILAVLGIAGIVIGFNLPNKSAYWIRPFLYLIGLVLMIASLANFFATGDQSGTFIQVVPLTTFTILSVCFLCFLIYSITLFQKPLSKSARIIS
jgi:hypothetical protein